MGTKATVRRLRTRGAPPPPEIPGRISSALARFGRTRTAYIVASLLLLIPCYWQPRVQAGDLSSHIYNAWLAQLIETGRTQGLVVVGQTTNILFDLMLGGLFRVVGAEAAQRIAVSIAVLVFVWGAFAFIREVSGGTRWFLMPCIAMLAYGWVFHMGFFNFYLSMGLCLWALALAWRLQPARLWAAAGVMVPAFLAHALPVAWAVSLIAFLWITRSMEARGRIYTTAAFLVAGVLLSAAIGRTMVSSWSLDQVGLTTGADQVRVFDAKYYLVFFALLLIWGVLFLKLLRGAGARQVASSVAFQFCVLSAAGVAILPNAVLLPGFQHKLAFMAERMSLGVAVCLCALLGSVPYRKIEARLLVGLAAVFFVFLFHDERALNSLEDRMENVVAQLPPGLRVINGVMEPALRINSPAHMIDRECLGRCYSYGNYEASTWQFRVRALAPNPVVTSVYADSWLMEVGAYVVKPHDVPLYQVFMNRAGDVSVRSLNVGEQCGITYWKLPGLLPIG